jgi:tetratricopeptide (TPR) repeat protein
LKGKTNLHFTDVTKRSKKSNKRGPTLSPSKRRLFFAITISFPFIVIALAEVTLRLFHVGSDLSLFTTDRWYGKEYYGVNPDVKQRYFPTMTFSPSVSPDYFSIRKEPGTYRIFCLGGSTTAGYPYWYNGSFSSFLRDRLRAVFPDKRIEIVNVGLTATNSFTVLDMAQDLVRYEPDLFIVYDGHNEFYGALGIASNESLGSTRWITKAFLTLIHYRTFALLKDLYAKVRGMLVGSSSSRDSGTLMEHMSRGQYVPFRSTKYNDGLRIFKANLEDLRKLCAEHHVPLIISTQASNLRDQPPFVSAHPTGAPSHWQTGFDGLMKSGHVEMQRSRFDSALFYFRQAAALDSLYADTRFGIAQCLDALGRHREARQEYIRARDYDQLRFRTSTDFNDLMRSMADGRQVILADMQRVFDHNSPDSITGKNLIFEHLHPRSHGYFLMAAEYARLMRAHSLLADADEWAQRDTVSNERLWNERNVTELDERLANRRTEVLTSGWPFQAHVPIVDPVAPNDTLGEITEQVSRGKWDWKQAHEATAEYYLLRHDLSSAEREYKVIVDQLPLIDVQDYLRLAKVLLDQNKIGEMREALIGSLALEPTILAYRALGDVALQSNRPSEAIPYYEKVAGFTQSPAEQVENGYLLGLALYRAGIADKAKKQMLHVLKIKPDFQPAIEILSRLQPSGH